MLLFLGWFFQLIIGRLNLVITLENGWLSFRKITFFRCMLRMKKKIGNKVEICLLTKTCCFFSLKMAFNTLLKEFVGEVIEEAGSGKSATSRGFPSHVTLISLLLLLLFSSL